jgi:hypothetical protein
MIDAWNRDRPLKHYHDDLEQYEEDRRAKRQEEEANRRKNFDDALDRGLEDTFPGSDPVAVTQPPHSYRDKRRP